MYIRESELAFENAIKLGMIHPGDYMYMYSDGNYDFFKHCCTRSYVCYRYKGAVWILISMLMRFVKGREKVWEKN